MSKKESGIPPQQLAFYDKLVATHPEVQRKGVSMPYTSVNGHMFSIMPKDGRLGIRLGKATREGFQQKYGTGPFENYGAIMREYVAVPEKLLQNTAELSPYFAASYEYTKSLKPKPTTKKK